MSSDDSRPLSEVPLDELKERLQALRARRAQPRGTSASRTPGVIGPGETLARRSGGGGKRRSSMSEADMLYLAESLDLGLDEGTPSEP